MNQLQPTRTQLPADFARKLAAGIAESRASTVINAGGKPLLRLLKDGRWVFGQSDEEVQENSRWLINSLSIGHGYCCWVDGALRGEAMVSVFQPKPAQPAPIDGISFKEQRSFDLRCYDGDDQGTEVLYKVSSQSGMAESDRLFAALQARALEDQVYLFPLVQLKMSHYNHKQYGRTYTPILEIVGWCDQEGNLQGATAPRINGGEAQPSEAAKPVRQRKAPLGGAPASEPQTTQQAHAAPVRRRPGR